MTRPPRLDTLLEYAVYGMLASLHQNKPGEWTAAGLPQIMRYLDTQDGEAITGILDGLVARGWVRTLYPVLGQTHYETTR